MEMKILIWILICVGRVVLQNLPDGSSTVAVRHNISRYYRNNKEYCQKPAKCQQLNYTTCMGMKLPYSSSTLDLTDLSSQENVQERLRHYQYLRYMPKCWAVIQPFLCALYMPKCNETVDIPSREMCQLTLKPCKMFYNSSVFPKFFNCDDERIFSSNCSNDVQELRFNTTGFCMDPLVKTDNQNWFYPDVEGCGLRCKDSLYTENEHYQIHKLIGYCVVICGFLHLFTVLTFIIDWNVANKYPALAIFYVNVCFLISTLGWSIQFLNSETREDIVCKKDGTLRKSEPSATENLSCVIVFVLVYYFLIAGMVWIVIFSYTWRMGCVQALGKIQERVDKKSVYFHLVAWSLPLMFTITTMAVGEIDGDYVTGICFVGMVNFGARAGLLLTPLVVTMISLSYINVRGLILLIKVKSDSKEIIPEHSSRKIRSNIVRMGVFTLFKIVFCIITFNYHGYVFVNSGSWSASLQSYILCKLISLSMDFSHCKQESRPSVAMLQLQLLAVFGAGVLMSSWVWCPTTIHSWSRYIRKKFHCEVEDRIKLQKHHIIAQAYVLRDQFNQGGRISIDCQDYVDPLGLHIDLNNAATDSFSTTWGLNLPRLLHRRGAMVDEVGYSSNSLDSEVSHVSVRHVSIESRCNSGDSQLSVQISELKATRKVNRRHRNRRRKPDFRRNSRDVYGSSRALSRNGKHGSSGSLDSNLQFLKALTENGGTTFVERNHQRRPGNAGLDGQHIKNLLSNGKLVIPYPTKSGSEDENVSVTVSENKYNVVWSHNNLDLSDQLLMKSLKQGPQIQELSSSDGEPEKQPLRSGRESHQSRRSKRSRTSIRHYSDSED